MAHLTTLGLMPSVKKEKKFISVCLLEFLRGINENFYAIAFCTVKHHVKISYYHYNMESKKKER